MSTSEEIGITPHLLSPCIFISSQSQCCSIKGWGWFKVNVGELDRLGTAHNNYWSYERCAWAGNQSQNHGKSVWAYYLRDEVKFKPAHKHRILISKPLSLQLVTATKNTTQWIILSNVYRKIREVWQQGNKIHTPEEVCTGTLPDDEFPTTMVSTLTSVTASMTVLFCRLVMALTIVFAAFWMRLLSCSSRCGTKD